ncbi:tRNA-dihydrouridine synthase family protein [Patescibacteria group bacterium]|nr:tRNA-dihydrouridine synthase family protein [Patescibacteria group bacterium]
MSFSWSKNAPHLCSAPMDGISNSSQRQIFKKCGVDVVFTEMTNISGIKYQNRKTIQRIEYRKTEKPLIVQIFGNNQDNIAPVIKQIEKTGIDGIDFNAGCPARNILAQSFGGAFLKDIDLLIDILRKIRKTTKLPISLKTRTGFDKPLAINTFKKIATQSNIDCIIIHGRTVKQGYQGQADWKFIKNVAINLDVPVIGNGDITNPRMAYEYIQNYTPAGIMIGRGALGNPWIFEQTRKLLSASKIRPKPNIKKIIKTIKLHTKLLIKELQHEQHAILQMRKHYSWYIKNIPDAKKYRIKLLQSNSFIEVDKTLSNILKHYQT